MDIKIMNVEPKQVPEIISNAFSKLSELRENVIKANSKAQIAQNGAEDAKGKSAGLFKNKNAIESLQGAVTGLAEAQIAAVEAQILSFEYQEKLTQITKFLFALGVQNIHLTRSVIKELENGIENSYQLDDYATYEINSLINQLKAQEDVYNQLNGIYDKFKNDQGVSDAKDLAYDKCLKEHYKELASLKKENKELRDKINDMEVTLERLNSIIEKNIDTKPQTKKYIKY